MRTAEQLPRDPARRTLARIPYEAATPGAKGYRQVWPALWNVISGANLERKLRDPNHRP